MFRPVRPARVVPLAAGLLVVALLSACSRTAPEPEPVRSVRTLQVGSDTAGGVKEFAAEVRARTESRLGFRVGGKLTQRPADLGETVRAGQVLATLDATDLEQARQAAVAALAAAQSNHEALSAEYRRFEELRAQGFISAWELERRGNALKAAKAQLDQARAQAQVQSNQAGYAQLTAPAAGVVTAVEAEPGAVVAAGAPVLRLALEGPRDVVFSVPEDMVQAMRSRVGQPDALKVRFWGSDAVVAATLRELAASADPSTRTFLAKADVGRAPVQLGQTATVLMDLPRQSGVVKLPVTAIVRQQDRAAVWVVDRASMTVKQVPVVVAGADGNEVVVAAGLQAGMDVVTAGVHVLSPGQKVKFFNPTPVASR
jgi:RND family efflux transporter MFP subunit